jgi:hypothetical protein
MSQVDLLDGFSPAAMAEQNGYTQGSITGLITSRMTRRARSNGHLRIGQ